jgi:UDP-hydrolysing UDP-N-acetyl-D-glucosamine 2-epimerase
MIAATYAGTVRTVAVATTSRAEYGSCRPLLRALARDEELAPRILVGGTHLLADWGMTVNEIDADGLAPVERVGAFAGATPQEAAESIAAAARGFAASFAHAKPDVLVVVGDRVELLGIVGAALPYLIPVAHISGGDSTGGAVDDLVRHAVSKLAHLHLVAMEEHAERLQQMGEASWRITVTGDPAIDDVRGPWPDRAALAASLERSLEPPVGVVGFHPATLSQTSPAAETRELLAALDDFPGTLVVTHPGADPGANEVAQLLQRFVATHPRAVFRTSLGQDRYYGLLAQADVLIGNSSSGIWEAPSFELPVVNVGSRQNGRIRARNVIDVPARRDAISQAVAHALEPTFRESLRGLENPYGDGHASDRIVAVLRSVELDHRLIAKWSG